MRMTKVSSRSGGERPLHSIVLIHVVLHNMIKSMFDLEQLTNGFKM